MPGCISSAGTLSFRGERADERRDYWRGGFERSASQRFNMILIASLRLIRALPAGFSAVIRAASSSRALMSAADTLNDKMVSSSAGRIFGRPTSGSLADFFGLVIFSVSMVVNIGRISYLVKKETNSLGFRAVPGTLSRSRATLAGWPGLFSVAGVLVAHRVHRPHAGLSVCLLTS